MTVRSSGLLSLTDLQKEFGGSAPISISEYYRGGAYTTTNNVGVAASGLISGASFYGTSKYIPGYRFFTTSSSIILPSTCGTTIYYYVIGGGGGGGGGSSRITYGYGGGGGGGCGGNSYGTFSAAPGDTIRTIVGGGGTAGGARDGPYSAGTSGGTGGYSQIIKNDVSMCSAWGGNGGKVAQSGNNSSATPGGAVGGIIAGSYIQSGGAGQYAQNGIWWSVGGAGGAGFSVNYYNGGYFYRQGAGSGGIGYHNGYTMMRYAVTASGYGGGGSGGGAMVNADNGVYNGSSGAQGIVLIWW